MLIRATNKKGFTSLLVRGGNEEKFALRLHIDVATPTTYQLTMAGWKHEVLGGGMIEHYPDAKIIRIYGPQPSSLCVLWRLWVSACSVC